MTSPVLVLAFNRPDKLQSSLDAISTTSVTEVTIFLDGPRMNTNDQEKIEQCVNVIKEFRNRFSILEVIRRTENLGCRLGVQEALNYFFKKYDCGLIVEDDVLISQDFVDFATWGLREYRHDRKIWVVNGWSPFNVGEVDSVPWLSRIPTVWGWATWSDRWQFYDSDIESSLNCIPSQLPSNNPFPANENFDRYWSRCFELIREGWNTWDFQLVFTMWKYGGMALTPPVRLTQNIGFDSEATHTHTATRRSNAPRASTGFDKRRYPFVSNDTDLLVFAEEIQFGYHQKKPSEKKVALRKDFVTSIVCFLADLIDGSQFALKNHRSVNLRFTMFRARIFFSLRRLNLNSAFKGIRSRIFRLSNYLYWGIRSRIFRLSNYLYWGIRSQLSKVLKKKK
jgi:hypothetical protein